MKSLSTTKLLAAGSARNGWTKSFGAKRRFCGEELAENFGPICGNFLLRNWTSTTVTDRDDRFDTVCAQPSERAAKDRDTKLPIPKSRLQIGG
jgi:hypothetical protein